MPSFPIIIDITVDHASKGPLSKRLHALDVTHAVSTVQEHLKSFEQVYGPIRQAPKPNPAPAPASQPQPGQPLGAGGLMCRHPVRDKYDKPCVQCGFPVNNKTEKKCGMCGRANGTYAGP